MDLGILVMALIILINLVVVGAVMYFGSQHDTHTEIRHPESSKSVQTLMKQADAAARKSGSAASQSAAPVAVKAQAESVGDQGDQEEEAPEATVEEENAVVEEDGSS